MKIGIIDIGGNTIHVDVFQVKDAYSFHVIASDGVVNRLGIYLTKTRHIPHEKVMEAAIIIERLRDYAIACGAETVLAFGTSIVRHAANRDFFVTTVKERCGLIIDVVSGFNESCYLEKIAKIRYAMKKTPALLVDIGGGSTEYVLFDQEQTYVRKSYRYGLSKVKRMLVIRDFDNEKTIAMMKQFFDRKVRLIVQAKGDTKIEQIIGTSSVVKTIARYKYKYSDSTNEQALEGQEVTYSDLQEMRDILRMKSELDGISQDRADLVYIGIFFLLALLRATNNRSLIVGAYSVREGYLVNYLEKIAQRL